MLPLRTILHPTDFSEGSDLAFRLACALARDYGARLVVMHVAVPSVLVYGEGVLPARAEDYLVPLREQLERLRPRTPSIPVEYRLVEGDAATEILRAARETRCDVILMGTHGRTGLRRLLMGSVAEQVVRRAMCPVVTVKFQLTGTRISEEVEAETIGESALAPQG
jgi:nucleotide-binding universal stress UspA family protein